MKKKRRKREQSYADLTVAEWNGIFFSLSLVLFRIKIERKIPFILLVIDETKNAQETVIYTGRAAQRECFRVSFDLSGYGILNRVRNFLRKTEIDDCSSKWWEELDIVTIR